MKKLFTTNLLLLVFVPMLWAQYFPSEVWHEGSVTTIDGESYKGKVKYNLEADIIQLSANNTLKTFSAKKLLYFEIFDVEYGRYREFYSLPYQISANYKTPRIFEVLYENTLTLLCREEIVQQTNTINDPFFFGNQMVTRYRLDYDYYFLDKDGNIQYFSQKKDDLYDMFPRNKPEIEKYIKKNKLKPDRQRDLVRVTAYYNSLLNS